MKKVLKILLFLPIFLSHTGQADNASINNLESEILTINKKNNTNTSLIKTFAIYLENKELIKDVIERSLKPSRLRKNPITNQSYLKMKAKIFNTILENVENNTDIEISPEAMEKALELFSQIVKKI